MEFHFGIVNTIATVFTILITLLNIIVYKLRQIQEANLGDITDENLGESSRSPSSSGQACRHFTLGEIQVATNNFDDTLVTGRGGFGKVYKGVIDGGALTVAIKRSDPMSRQGAHQFWTEVDLLSKFWHSHLVSLVGYCYNIHEMILIYEYMPRGSLADHLYKAGSNLSWIQRLRVCIGAGQGLDYLHTGTGINDRVIHRDMKSSNILLDENWAAKVSDFGLSKIGPANQDLTHVSTNVKGTYGFLDPEYMTTHRLTRKSDVYSFGVVLLEVLSGKRAMDPKICEKHWDLAGWAKECIKKKDIELFIDPYLKHEILQDSLKEFVQIAEKCLQYRAKRRPKMAEVVVSLEHVLALQEREGSTMLEEDFMNLGWTTSNNHENCDYSTLERNQLEVIHDNMLSGDATLQSRAKQPTSKIIPLKRMARFFFGKPRVDSEYDFDAIKAATNNFSLKLGQGESGVVYKGVLPNGQEIAVKKFSKNSSKDESEFRNEISLLAKLQHRNIVRLLGFCSKGNTERLLIYEFVPNLSLDNYIYANPLMRGRLLDWEVCKKIIRGVSMGIIYLHEESPERIIHRDIKPRHILLDSEMNPKISSFGHAISFLGLESGTSVSRIYGTIGYISPEYHHTFRISVETDVFTFGLLVLNIISGRKAYNYASDGTGERLQDYALRNWRSGMLWDILISPHLCENGSEVMEEIKRYIKIALLCTQKDEVVRPTMSEVLTVLNNLCISLPEPSLRTSSSMPASFVDVMYNDTTFVNEFSSELPPI